MDGAFHILSFLSASYARALNLRFESCPRLLLPLPRSKCQFVRAPSSPTIFFSTQLNYVFLVDISGTLSTGWAKSLYRNQVSYSSISDCFSYSWPFLLVFSFIWYNSEEKKEILYCLYLDTFKEMRVHYPTVVSCIFVVYQGLPPLTTLLYTANDFEKIKWNFHLGSDSIRTKRLHLLPSHLFFYF